MSPRPIVLASFHVVSQCVSTHAYRGACRGATQQADVRSAWWCEGCRLSFSFSLFLSLSCFLFWGLAFPHLRRAIAKSFVIRTQDIIGSGVFQALEKTPGVLARDARRRKTRREETGGVSFLFASNFCDVLQRERRMRIVGKESVIYQK